MENCLFVGVLLISFLNYNSGQLVRNQTAIDLDTFVIESFSKNDNHNNVMLELTTLAPASNNTTQSEVVVMDDFEELVGSIFYKNASLNEPDAIIPCNNGDLGPGECTHFYLCSDNRTIIDDGSGKTVIDFRLNVDEVRECPVLKPCCSLKNAKPMTEVKKEYVRKLPTACGLRNRNGLQFIATNQPPHQAQEGEFAWTVAVLERNVSLKSNEESQFICGGSIIHPKVVMTAAHCLKNVNLSRLFVRGGDWDSLSVHEFLPHQDRDVQEIIVHELFNPDNGFYDIALLVLAAPFEIAENVNTICLPPIDYDFASSVRCFASGWGTLSWKEFHFLSIMKRIELPMVDHNQCQDELRRTRLGIHFQLHDSFICAGGEKDVDTCFGDGGSPLACPIPGTDNQYYQAGIVSWGIGCGDTVPAVYVNVSHLRKWIDDQITRKNLESSTYDAEASKKIDYRHPL